MRILITGGLGYIGSYLSKRLSEIGHTITILDSQFNHKNLNFVRNIPSTRFIKASTMNIDSVLRSMGECSVIFHLASRMDWSTNYRQPLRLCQNNVQGTATILSAARMVGIEKVIFASSAAVYGNLVPAREIDPCVPVNMYGSTKLAAEAICRGFYNMGMDISILRLFSVWGKEGSESVINRLTNGHNRIYFDGQQTRDFVFIDDVIDALVASINWESNIYNIGTGEEATINSIWTHLHPNNEPEYTEPSKDQHTEIFRSCADITFTKKSTGWSAKTKISELSSSDIFKLC